VEKTTKRRSARADAPEDQSIQRRRSAGRDGPEEQTHRKINRSRGADDLLSGPDLLPKTVRQFSGVGWDWKGDDPERRRSGGAGYPW